MPRGIPRIKRSTGIGGRGRRAIGIRKGGFRLKSGGGGFQFEGSKEMARWAAGLRASHVSDEMVERWSAATDLVFDRTQQVVHVISGNLKASGRSETEASETEITGTITYGDGVDVDYAIYEIARGGSHDFMGRGLADASATFERALGESMDIMLSQALGVD